MFLAFAALAFANPFHAASAPTAPSLDENQLQLDMVTVDMLRGTCDGGDAIACHRLGRRYEHGLGGAKVSAPDAAAYYRKGCDGGIGMDCGLAANALAHVGDAAAWPLAKKACDAKDAFGCYVLGHLEVVGLGVAADPAAGFAKVRAGCDAGLPNACAELGLLYAGAAPGVPADPAKAHPLLATACDAGDATACGWLGSLLLQGKGAPVDVTRGLAVLGKGCDAGDGPACESLGAAWLQGIGVTADAAKSVPWFRKACAAKVATSCGQLATMTLQGQGGISADRAKAVGHLRDACTYGLAAACQELDSACRSGATDACR